MVEIIDYNVFTTPFKELPCLEDAIQKGYSTDDEQNKTEYISVRTYPSTIMYSMMSLLKPTSSKYVSVIERYGILYGISLTMENEEFKKIKNLKEELITSITDPFELDVIFGSGNLPFKTRTVSEHAPIKISLPRWCSEWIHSEKHTLNIDSGKLAVFMLVLALSRSDIPNSGLLKSVQEEAQSFLNHLVRERKRLERLRE